MLYYDTYIYCDLDLIRTLTFTKSMVLGVRNSIKLVFDSISTNRPTIIIFSLIFFILEGDEKSFHEDYVQIHVLSLKFMQG